MRGLALVPLTGISARQFAGWMGQPNIGINDLIEMGFIQEKAMCMIALHPMMQEITVADTKPSVTEQVLRFGTADISSNYLVCIQNAARSYVADIFATLRRYEYNPDFMRLTIVGGGGCLVRNFGEYDASRVTIIDDICATAKRYEYLAFTALRRKEDA